MEVLQRGGTLVPGICGAQTKTKEFAANAGIKPEGNSQNRWGGGGDKVLHQITRA